MGEKRSCCAATAGGSDGLPARLNRTAAGSAVPPAYGLCQAGSAARPSDARNARRRTHGLRAAPAAAPATPERCVRTQPGAPPAAEFGQLRHRPANFRALRPGSAAPWLPFRASIRCRRFSGCHRFSSCDRRGAHALLGGESATHWNPGSCLQRFPLLIQAQKALLCWFIHSARCSPPIEPIAAPAYSPSAATLSRRMRRCRVRLRQHDAAAQAQTTDKSGYNTDWRRYRHNVWNESI